MLPLEVLFDGGGSEMPLPPELHRLYGGDLGFDPPRLYANFVSSLDGVVALDAAGVSSGGAISGGDDGDRFVMGLLRALADVVLIGAGTLRDDPGHLWTPAYIHPPAAAAYARLRSARGLSAEPRLAILTAGGDLDPKERAIAAGALILTSGPVAGRLRGRLPATCEVVGLGPGPEVELGRALAALRDRGHGVILTEGGPHVAGRMLAEGLLDELFLTLSPVLAGSRPGRLGLAEGVELLPGGGRWAQLAGVRRSGSHLLCRYLLTRASR